MSENRSFPLAEAVRAAYRAGEDDETMEPIVLVDGNGQPLGRIQDGDYVIFYDIRGEREIELTEAFVAGQFSHFERSPIKTHWVTMIEYEPGLVDHVAFEPLGVIQDTLSETVSKAGLRQVKIVESEKSVHVTYYLNGKRSEPFIGEERRIVPSREFEGYWPPPEMRADAVADTVIDALRDPALDLVVVNWANTDVIGHSEDAEAIKKAVSTVDTQLGRVLEVVKETGVVALITADHGTVEKWYYEDGTIDTGHTDSPVPFVLAAPQWPNVGVRRGGTLVDVAPTVLDVLDIEKPAAMTGTSLLAGRKGTGQESAQMGARAAGRQRVVLIILDGWGARNDPWGNLILAADTPVMDHARRKHPSTVIEAAGEAVGLPNSVPNRPGKTVGNSEVGHMHIGAGRVIPSDRLRIERAIDNGSFFQNPAFRWAMRGAQRDGTRLHLLGIISFYSSHGSVEHLKALLRMAQHIYAARQAGAPPVYVHGMLGRRGEKPESGAIYVGDIESECQKLGIGQFVSLIGRFWSLDREHNWDRIEKSYRWLVSGQGRAVPAR
jgi:2,3-bisphosphoglycerate-independent phosphoglycerate mutase